MPVGPCLCECCSSACQPSYTGTHSHTHSLTTNHSYPEPTSIHAHTIRYDATSIGKILGNRIWHKSDRRPQMNSVFRDTRAKGRKKKMEGDRENGHERANVNADGLLFRSFSTHHHCDTVSVCLSVCLCECDLYAKAPGYNEPRRIPATPSIHNMQAKFTFISLFTLKKKNEFSHTSQRIRFTHVLEAAIPTVLRITCTLTHSAAMTMLTIQIRICVLLVLIHTNTHTHTHTHQLHRPMEIEPQLMFGMKSKRHFN